RRSSHRSSFPTTHRRPPSSTLFPYTTLFRSGLGATIPGSAGRRRPGGERSPDRRGAQLLVRPRRGHGPRDAARERGDGGAARAEDRKSTRLNSSHVKISYAVFCLKKKKKKYT